MQKHVGWLSVVGFFGLLTGAAAQTSPSPTASTRFDGTYAFVSATRVIETYIVTGSNRIGQCGVPRADRRPSPLTIANGQAQFTGGNGRQFEGTVSSQGELAMRSAPNSPGKVGWYTGLEVSFYGRIDGGGTVRARAIGYFCSYDLIWQKTSR